MAAVAHSKVSIAQNVTGYNITDSGAFQALVAGAGNGSFFAYHANDFIVLKNTTGGAAVFTFKVPLSAAMTAAGATITSPTLSVAAAKSYFLRLSELFKDVSTTYVIIECDVAGSILVLNVGIV